MLPLIETLFSVLQGMLITAQDFPGFPFPLLLLLLLQTKMMMIMTTMTRGRLIILHNGNLPGTNEHCLY